jgi:hypothetical protein
VFRELKASKDLRVLKEFRDHKVLKDSLELQE